VPEVVDGLGRTDYELSAEFQHRYVEGQTHSKSYWRNRTRHAAHHKVVRERFRQSPPSSERGRNSKYRPQRISAGPKPERLRRAAGGTSATAFIVSLAMRREAVGCLAVLALATGCSENEATSDGETASGKSDRSTELRRPLHLPSVARGAACPVTAGGRPSPDVAIALGSGPAYPVLGFEGNHAPPSPKAVVPLYAEERKGNVYWHKTLWAVRPTYDGPVLIRGAGIDPPQPMRFGYDDRQLGELEFPPQQSDSWRYGPSFTIVPGPGCFAFQVDGVNFSKVIVFEAALAAS
jgi:hypothetical protein